MHDSFLKRESTKNNQGVPDRRRVLITGAAGKIGSHFASQCHQRYDLVLADLDRNEHTQAIEPYGQVVFANITDLEAMHDACQGVDTVVHLAGNTNPSGTWASLLKNNIEGTYNVMVAAKAAGCRRVVYASSVHAVSGHSTQSPIESNAPTNPGDLYGVSKSFGEAMGRYMAEQQGLSVIAIRIGWFRQPEFARTKPPYKVSNIAITRDDMTQLLCRCIDNTDLQFAIVNAASDLEDPRLDLRATRQLLGYEPTTVRDESSAASGTTLGRAQSIMHNESEGSGISGIREDLARLADRPVAPNPDCS